MDLSALMPETTLPVELESKTRAAASRMDEESFRAFYERTARPVWAYLVRITGEAQLADDLLQEAFYRFYRARTVYESESHRRNSLFRIATNLAHDHGRRRRRGVDVPIGEEAEAVHADASPADRVTKRMDLGRALARLRPLQREILWLAYAQGSSHEEIAGMVGVSRKSIKSLLFRARKKLAELMEAK
ncbi:MAG TPA: RNA polymerase sigma factor [Thermoanaerobaculia bacterium]|jgi:RNA polymerase sigma-70 factor (ECF subfamily)|nr:RNA polymerase sigma factor [Thermoanaerobaculia bacterium]